MFDFNHFSPFKTFFSCFFSFCHSFSHPRKLLIRTVLFSIIFQFPETANAAPLYDGTISEPRILEQLEKQGLSFAERLGSKNSEATNEELIKEPTYASIVNDLQEDLEALHKSDRQLGVGMQWKHRLFDKFWLTSKEAKFVLVGIVPRLDRKIFTKSSTSCGEIRSVYRLQYTHRTPKGILSSYLPLTVNVVSWADGDNSPLPCQRLARGFLEIARLQETAPLQNTEQFMKVLLAPDGVLSLARFDRQHLKSIEFNLQSVRWPSTVRPEFGNHAEYLLRVFRMENSGKTQLSPLENTPDVPRLLRNPRLKAELFDWLDAHHTELDDGTAVIPEKFLAIRATSIAPRGSERLANQPFTELFQGDQFTFDFSTHRYSKTPAAFLRRLNDLSCVGCHQNRGIAGFHFLGEDRVENSAGNQLGIFASPHFFGDQERRIQYLKKLAAGETPNEFRPISERSDFEKGVYGVHCGLGDPSFHAWVCNEGLRCLSVGDPLVGECFPETPHGGDPCEISTVRNTQDPRTEAIQKIQKRDCPGVCETTAVGFPRGMCSSTCEDLPSDNVCGDIAILSGFNACLAQGEVFSLCLAKNVRPGALHSCSNDAPCRDDYVCSKTLHGQNACIPPYFLFQLRVDGHPTNRDNFIGRFQNRLERILR